MRRKNPERMAWLVLWCAFLIFLGSCAAVPVGARSYLLYSSSPKQALFEWTGGTPSVQEPNGAPPIALTPVMKSLQVPEGSVIETDANSRGIITFFDGSTLQIFPNTRITLTDMHVSTFDWGRVPITMVIDQTRGRILVSPAPLYATSGAQRQRQFEVRTDHFVASLTEGSYAVDASPDSAQIVARNGVAQVQAQGKTVTISMRQRTVVTRGNPPLAPLPAEQDLMVNGDFMDPPERGWNSYQDPPTPGIPSGVADVVMLGDRRAGHIVRTNSNQVSAVTGMVQTINREVSDFHVLKLSADVRLHLQSLSGGGYLSSEYPLILRLRYRDVYGSEVEWVHGFYYQNTTNNPTNNGEIIPADVWVPFESGNLFETLEFKPFYITTLQIYASGWDYESYVTNIRLVAE